MHLRLVHCVASHRLSYHLQFIKKGDVRCSTGFLGGRWLSSLCVTLWLIGAHLCSNHVRTCIFLASHIMPWILLSRVHGMWYDKYHMPFALLLRSTVGGLIVVMYGELTFLSLCIIDQVCLIPLFAVEWVPACGRSSARPLRFDP